MKRFNLFFTKFWNYGYIGEPLNYADGKKRFECCFDSKLQAIHAKEYLRQNGFKYVESNFNTNNILVTL
jgi:hypothetical protein